MNRPLGQFKGRKRSAAALRNAARYEAPEVMDHGSTFPIVVRKACGSRVVDCDGNRYIDLTGFFGVSLVGHRNPAVTKALRSQIGRLLHGMGDVHPSDVKLKFLAELARRLPAPDYLAVLSLNGSDAVETALKFAAAATGKPGVIAFEGSYHGLSSGALEVTHIPVFREQFRDTLSNRAVFLPFPALDGSDAEHVLELAREAMSGRMGPPIGAVIVEPIQGRGGVRVPPPGFLANLSRLATSHECVFIADEIYTGCGRTGTFLACEAMGVIPDCVCLGKALGGGVPLSACLMRPRVSDGVKGAGAEAVHTSTFLGHPLAAAAGIAVLKEIALKGLMDSATAIGAAIMRRAGTWKKVSPIVRDVRGIGAMVGVELARGDGTPATDEARRVVETALKRGVVVLAEGPAGNVLAFTPPLTIDRKDLDWALGVVEDCLLSYMDIR